MSPPAAPGRPPRPKRSSCARGSSLGQKTKVSKPSSVANSVRVSTQCSGGPSSSRASARRRSRPRRCRCAGPRTARAPAATAASSIRAASAGTSSGVAQERGHPAVGEPSRQREPARLAHAEPDLDQVRGRRARMEAAHPVVLAFERDRPLPAPEGADEADRLLERAQRLACRADGSPHRADRLPEGPAPSPSSNRPPESASRVAACFASMAGGRSGRLATSGKDAPAPCVRAGRRSAPTCRAPLVRVVLDPDQVEPELVGAGGDRR